MSERNGGTDGNGKLKSTRWFEGDDVPAFVHRTALRAEGFATADFEGRPVIGICNSWSELINCNVHFRALANSVKRGVLQAGGLPLEFPTMALGEQLMKPTTMLFRNLMAMDVEESIRAHPLDAVVLIAGCDKTVPAQLLGAASADVPAIMLTGGPATPAVFRGKEIGVGTDLWEYTDDLRAGRMTREEYDELEAASGPSAGHCPEMGTASTLAAVVEGLGMTLPGAAAAPAVDARRYQVAGAIGRRAVEIAEQGVRPSRILTAEAFDNAITVLLAVGGSTNAVIHLLALARRCGVDLDLDRFDELSRRTPLLADIRPSGRHLVEQLFHAGGVPALMKELEPLLALDAPTIAGPTVGENLAKVRPSTDREVIATLAEPVKPAEGLAVVRGSLAPRRRRAQGQRRRPGAAHPPRPRGGVRRHGRHAGPDRRPRPRGERRLGADPARRRPGRRPRGCRSGGRCRSRRSCWKPACATWSGSPTRG